MELQTTIETDLFQRCLDLQLNLLPRLPFVALPSIVETMQLSQSLCPIDTGALVTSDFIKMDGLNYNKEEVKFTFGYHGENVNPKTGKLTSTYAIEVHEDLMAFRRTGQAKFLEAAVEDMAQFGQEVLAEEMVYALAQAIKGG